MAAYQAVSKIMTEAEVREVKARLAELGNDLEFFLGECMKGRHIPCELVTAMEYSLMAGGKRVRPALCLTFAELFGLDRLAVLPFAGAIECIHTYSLIHDDLSAMDDDDLRRGKPSSHKKFGEATAILAGDGLLTEAFGFMAEVGLTGDPDGEIPPDSVLMAILEIARSAGAVGMVGGQLIDMDFTGKSNVPLKQLRAMHAMKTGALIRGSCVAGALLAGAMEEDLERVAAYGEAIGVAFQIVDDILDETGDEAELGKPVGSDAAQGKTTYPSLMGLEESWRLAMEHVDRALGNLKHYEGEEADFLRLLARYILARAK